MTNSQQNITQREYIIDIDKFDKLIENYVNGTFAFSKSELSETIEEIGMIVRRCIIEHEIVDNQPSLTLTINDHPCYGCECKFEDYSWCPDMKTCLDYHICNVARITRKEWADKLFEELMNKRFITNLSENYIVWSGDVEDMIESLRGDEK